MEMSSKMNYLSIALLLGIGAIAGMLYIAGRFQSRRGKNHPLPPGAKPLPLLGNIRDLPSPGQLEWEHWGKHREIYGPISFISVLGNTIIILNDAKAAIQLLEKRANLHSARPTLTFAGEMVGWDHVLIFAPPDRLRSSRRQIHSILGTQATLAKFESLQEVEVQRFLLRVLETPEDLLQHVKTLVKREAGAIILKLTYGYSIEPRGSDPLVYLVEEPIAHFTLASVTGAWMVDIIPTLKYLPDWFPGAQFKRTAKSWKATLMRMVGTPIRFVKQQMALQHYELSFVSDLLNKSGGKMNPEEEYIATFTAAALYIGGSDTVRQLCRFAPRDLLTLGKDDVQRKAQEEIERMVGSHRLPALADRAKLPYVGALVKETLRWHAIAPLGLPHMAAADNVWEGYLIPKGATLIPNIWWFTHDPEIYPDPDIFNPERFLGDSVEQDPGQYVFGFGRRVCPGRLLAESSIWLSVAMSLAAFDIRPTVDLEGHEIKPDANFSPVVVSHPVPFKANIQPRTPKYEKLIREVEVLHPWGKCGAETLEGLLA